MSTTILKIISTSPYFKTDILTQEKIKAILFELFNPEQIEIITTDSVDFIDQGQNFESVSCPLCKQHIEIEVWQNMMDLAFQNQFTNLVIITPCCNKERSLNDLIYQWPAGFAKFVINIYDPESKISEKQIMELENLLGTNLRVIWAHY